MHIVGRWTRIGGSLAKLSASRRTWFASMVPIRGEKSPLKWLTTTNVGAASMAERGPVWSVIASYLGFTAAPIPRGLYIRHRPTRRQDRNGRNLGIRRVAVPARR